MVIDFEKMYNGYVNKWIQENPQKLKGGEPLDYVNEIYTKWINTPVKQAGGLTPSEYFARLDAEEAVNMLKEYVKEGVTTPSPLIDILGNKKYENELITLINQGVEEELLILAVNILEEMQSVKHIKPLINIMLSEGGKETRDFACEILSLHSDIVKESLIQNIKLDCGGNDMYIADVLVYSKGDERIYKLLVKLFNSGVNYTLYAAYLGMYGDERALPLLQQRINSEETGYVEYTELRNAIERLGGEVQGNRDFSHDPDYKVLKNLH